MLREHYRANCALGRWGATSAPLSLGRWLAPCAMPLPARYDVQARSVMVGYCSGRPLPRVACYDAHRFLGWGAASAAGAALWGAAFCFATAGGFAPPSGALRNDNGRIVIAGDNDHYRGARCVRGVCANASVARWVSLAYARLPPHVTLGGGLRIDTGGT